MPKRATERGIKSQQVVAALPVLKRKNGWVIFDLPAGAPKITNASVEEAEKAAYEEEYRRAFPSAC